MADNRASVYWEDGKLVIRASSFGGCISSLVRTGMGITGNKGNTLDKAFAQGIKAEPLIVEKLRDMGWVIQGAGEAQEEYDLDLGPVIVRCHPDGVKWEPDADGLWSARRVLEIKALSPTFNRDFPPYKWQGSIESLATGLPLTWIYGTKDENGDVDLENLEIVNVDDPVHDLLAVKKRALAIYRAVKAESPPPCDYKQFPCAHWQEDDTLCGKQEAEELPLPPHIIDAFIAAKKVKEDADKDFAAASDHIKAILEDRAGERYKSGPLTMTKVSSTKFDKKAAEKDGVDVGAYTVATKAYWRIGVSE